MAHDGSIRIDTKLNTKNAERNINSLGVSIQKVGKIVTSAFAIAKIVKFGKSAVGLASDLEEVQNVVDVAFGSMSDKANSFAKNALQSFGLSELSAKQYSSRFMAMAKSLGYSEKAASDMALSLTGLVGDVASFYNIEQDIAASKLKGVFTGETEALKDLGVVMTQTNLEQFALEKGIKKSLSAMTQAELTTLRYQYVTEQLSLAQGDFARTSDSWANQTRILSESLKSLSAICGEFLLKYLNPVVQKLNVMVQSLLAVAQAAKGIYLGSDAVEDMGKAAENTAKDQDKITESIEETGDAIEGNLASFDEINIMDGGDGNDNPNGGIEIPDTSIEVGEGSDVSPDISEATNKVNKYLVPAISTVKQILSKLVSTLSSIWNGAIKPIANALSEKVIPKVKELVNACGEFLQALEPIAGFINDKLLASIEKGGTAISAILGGGIGRLTTLINIATKALEDFSDGISDTTSISDFFTGLLEAAADILSGIISKISEWLPEILSAVNKAFTNIIQSLSKRLPEILKTAKAAFDTIISTLMKNLPLLLDAVIQILTEVVKIVIDNLPLIIDMAQEIIAAIVKGICDNLPLLSDAVIQIVKTLLLFIIDNLPTLTEGAIDIVLAIVDGILQALPQLAEAAIKIIESLVKFLLDPDNIGKIVEMCISIVTAIAKGLISAGGSLVSAAGELVQGIWNAFINTDWLEVGRNIISGIWEGFKSLVGTVTDNIKNSCQEIWSGIKSFFGINSPSALMRDTVGNYVAMGIGVGFEDEVEDVTDGMADSLQDELDDWSVNGDLSAIKPPSVNLNELTPVTVGYSAVQGGDTSVRRLAGIVEDIAENISEMKNGNDGDIVVQIVDGDGSVKVQKTVKNAKRENRKAGKTVISLN